MNTNRDDKDVSCQLAVAGSVMDQYADALRALAGEATRGGNEEFERQVRVARKRMKKYEVAYRVLAK